ncbi:MAG TPA: hypothetical protein PLM50_04265 [Rectinema sp.]|jgi:predicted house-cleaning noncanonical NTP pyrophosphatase (MazG superfamily)|nr:hypothetical protein [Rectinema sp.]
MPLIKDKDIKQENEIIIKDDASFREALKSSLIGMVADYMSSDDLDLLAESVIIMEELASMQGKNKRDFRAMCSMKRKEGGYAQRRYKEKRNDMGIPRNNERVEG